MSLAHISDGQEVQFSPVIQGLTEQDFKPQRLFPITLDQATCNYELFKLVSDATDCLVNEFKSNYGCPESREIHSWAWDTYTKARQLLDFYDCVSEQLEHGQCMTFKSTCTTCQRLKKGNL